MEWPCHDPAHKGHRRYVGGRMDGEVAHHFWLDPGDCPQWCSTTLSGGTRSWYEIDYEASDGTGVVYRFIGCGREFPLREVTS